MMRFVSACLALSLVHATPWRALGDWCERHIIASDFTDKLDHMRRATKNDAEYFDLLQREYIETGRVLVFRFDREKRAYLRNLGSRLRSFGISTKQYEKFEL